MHSRDISIDFDDVDSFAFDEEAYLLPGASVTGKVVLTRGSKDQDSDIRVDISTFATSATMLEKIRLGHTSASLSLDIHLSTHPDGAVPSTEDLCVLVYAVISIAPGASFTNLLINSSSLEIELARNLYLVVTNETSLHTISSPITSLDPPDFTSRRTIISAVSSPVTGSYPLLDLLQMTTFSGAIAVSVSPRAADPRAPRPASLVVRAHSGSVLVDFLTANLPERDYTVDVLAQSGDIEGVYAHGSRTQLVSRSGSVRAEVYPYLASTVDADAKTYLRTSTGSGGTELTLESPLGPGAAQGSTLLTSLHSVHEAASGGVALRYPYEWRGGISARTSSGSVAVEGTGLTGLRREREGGGGERVTARKGNGVGMLEVVNGAGSVSVQFP